MEITNRLPIEVPAGLLEAIRSFPPEREIEHCGIRMAVSPFDFHVRCGQCGARIKLRSFSAHAGIEDLFDAVFEWMNHPLAEDMAKLRQQALQDDRDE